MTTTCYSLIEDAIQDLLQGQTSSTTDNADQEGPAGEYQRLKVKADALESQIRVLRDAKRATDMACDLEPLSRSQNTMKNPRKQYFGPVGYDEESVLRNYWKDDSCEPAGEPAPRILEWTEKTIEGVIEALTQEQADETRKVMDLESNLPWNSPLASGPLIVRDQLQQRLSPLEKQLAYLRWQQNALIPIARILPELLIDIFELDLGTFHCPQRDDTNLLLTVIPRICRDWTRLVFNTPCLWNYIEPARSTMKHVAVALARSKPGPLSVHLHTARIHHIQQRQFLGAIKRHAHRLKVLHLGVDRELIDALNSIFAKWERSDMAGDQLFSRDPGTTHFSISLCTALGFPRELRRATRPQALSNSPNLESIWINSLNEPGGELTVGMDNLVAPVRLDRLREIILRLPPVLLGAILRSIRPIKLIKVDIETSMPQENQLVWTEVLLTNEIQPFVQVMESVLHSTPQIAFEIKRAHVKLWTESRTCEYNTPRVEPTFTGDRLAQVGRWLAASLDLGLAKVRLDIADEITSWVDTVPLILSKFHNTVKLNLDAAESVSQRASIS
ncbi:hypothetical protein FS837_011107 [Tulasnella sp. UAMH 9824]|nr:hypothetical protein FS837_011107 [Tulasnella sp. UAMH 9824]